jgi:hypothetical protein
MSFEDKEINNCGNTPVKANIRGVIVLTDNRKIPSNDKNCISDFRCSGYKGIPYSMQKLKLIPFSLQLPYQTACMMTILLLNSQEESSCSKKKSKRYRNFSRLAVQVETLLERLKAKLQRKKIGANSISLLETIW